MDLTKATLFKRWLINLSLSFFDIQIGYNNQLFDIESGNDVVQFGYSDSLTYIIPLFIILIIYSIYFICKQTKKKFVIYLTLIGMPVQLSYYRYNFRTAFNNWHI